MFPVIFTAIVIILMIVALSKELFNPAGIVFSALLLLLLAKVISVEEAFSGFSNKGMLTVGFLFVISAALQSSGAFESFILLVLGKKQNTKIVRNLRLMFPIAGLSAFLNNTPIVATLIPIIKSWAKRNNLPSSKYLIPLSYAAILGGTITLIGTSTNLVIHGLLLENGHQGFSFFEFSMIGIPVAIVSILFVSLFGNRLLPSRREIITKLGDETREFVAGLKVTNQYKNLNKSVEEADLRSLHGLFLFQIERDGDIISPVEPTEKILENDHLFFTGLTDTIFHLQKTKGLHLVKDREFNIKDLDSDKTKTYEAVLSNSSALIGQTVKDSGFRSHYNAVILAVHRSGERINRKIGEIVLQPNDTLFILSKTGFAKNWYHSKDFSLVTSSLDTYSKPSKKGNLALLILIGMIFAAITGLLPIITASAIAAILMIILNIISMSDAKKSVKWEILLLIASSFGIAKALSNSGIAAWIGNYMIDSLSFLGPIGILAGVFVLTSLSTLFITNNAVAAIIFPVALSIVQSTGFEMKPIMLILVFGASACFASPIGYQTNLMVYSAGGYKYTDFFKIGFSLNVIVGVVSVLMISFIYF